MEQSNGESSKKKSTIIGQILIKREASDTVVHPHKRSCPLSVINVYSANLLKYDNIEPYADFMQVGGT